MENAAKALLMIGGILLAVMTITILIYGVTTTGRIKTAQEEAKASQELMSFNAEYEAYNKKRMYGVDVISVVNKAIDQNKMAGASAEENPNYINIVIDTTLENGDGSAVNFKTTGEVINTTLPSSDPDFRKPMKDSEIEAMTTKNKTSVSLKGNRKYQLGYWSNGDHLTMDDGIIKFFEQNKTDEKIQDKEKIYYIYSALTNFKRAVFTCTGTNYSNGRINEMTFKLVQL